MIVIALLAIFVLLDIAVLAGWAPSTRDSSDWNVPDEHPHRRGPVHATIS